MKRCSDKALGPKKHEASRWDPCTFYPGIYLYTGNKQKRQKVKCSHGYAVCGFDALCSLVFRNFPYFLNKHSLCNKHTLPLYTEIVYL